MRDPHPRLAARGRAHDAVVKTSGLHTIRLNETLAAFPLLPADQIVMVTNAGQLWAKHVIHAVGPVWGGGDKGEEELLASCYRTALSLAAEHRLASIAFPAISTGIYRFPPDRAARIAAGAVAADIAHAARGIRQVVFCCLSPDAAAHHQNAFAELGLA